MWGGSAGSRRCQCFCKDFLKTYQPPPVAVNGGWKKTLARLNLEPQAVEIPKNVHTLFLWRFIWTHFCRTSYQVTVSSSDKWMNLLEVGVGGGGVPTAFRPAFWAFLETSRAAAPDEYHACLRGVGERASERVSEWDKCWREKKSARQQL